MRWEQKSCKDSNTNVIIMSVNIGLVINPHTIVLCNYTQMYSNLHEIQDMEQV